jgi:hypothetical protein
LNRYSFTGEEVIKVLLVLGECTVHKVERVQQTNILDTKMYIREARSWTVLDMIFLIWFAEFWDGITP